MRKKDEQEVDSEELWDSKALGQYGSGTEKTGRTEGQGGNQAGTCGQNGGGKGKGRGTLSQLDSGQR